MIDQPAPVGFSYCNNETKSHSCGGIAWTDELTSLNAYTALQAFYDNFPNYKATKLYLTGESYGGKKIQKLECARRDGPSFNYISYMRFVIVLKAFTFRHLLGAFYRGHSI
jgi:hypothetical protein